MTEPRGMHPAQSAAAPPASSPPKKLRSTAELDAPTVSDYINAWQCTAETEDELKRPGTIFGQARSWFVRAQYIGLYQKSLQEDNDRSIQIINGSAGIGKSAFLLYTLARLRLTGKCALLYYHPKAEKKEAIVVFFPAKGKGNPVEISSSDPTYYKTFIAWHELVGKDKSIFLVDGMVSFSQRNVDDVRYLVARSPSCSISFMEKSKNRRDRWLKIWGQAELEKYGTLTNIPNIEAIVADNMVYLGGICRYAFKTNAALDVALAAVEEVDANSLLKLVCHGLQAKQDKPKIVDRLVHYHPPPSGVGVTGRSFTFASEFVSSAVAKKLCLETKFTTAQLLSSYKGVGAAGSFRGTLFEAYAARKISEGGNFSVKEIASQTEGSLHLPPTKIYQKDSKTLNKSHYPPEEVKDTLVWPNPEYNLPAIDMLMFLSALETCIAHQMTVSITHSLDVKGVKAALKYFDSLCRELVKNKKIPDCYNLYFVVPADIYAAFSKQEQSLTDSKGAKVVDQALSSRVKQWVMKVE